MPSTSNLEVVEFDGQGEKNLGEVIAIVPRSRAGSLDLLNVSIEFSTTNASVPWAPAFVAPV